MIQGPSVVDLDVHAFSVRTVNLPLFRRTEDGNLSQVLRLVVLAESVAGEVTFVVPAGGFDLEEIDETLELRLTRAGDVFHPLDGSAPESVGEGEVAYASGAEILTRYFVHKQSRKALLDDSPSDGGGVANAVLEDFARGLQRHFGAEPATFIVEEDSSETPLR
jgi:DNA/RNA-binding domain of Phe-tRNA-synthetase-like protein